MVDPRRAHFQSLRYPEQNRSHCMMAGCWPTCFARRPGGGMGDQRQAEPPAPVSGRRFSARSSPAVVPRSWRPWDGESGEQIQIASAVVTPTDLAWRGPKALRLNPACSMGRDLYLTSAEINVPDQINRHSTHCRRKKLNEFFDSRYVIFHQLDSQTPRGGLKEPPSREETRKQRRNRYSAYG